MYKDKASDDQINFDVVPYRVALAIRCVDDDGGDGDGAFVSLCKLV